MSEIKQITIYNYDGIEYRRLDDIKAYLEDIIGAIIDKADVTLTPKQRLNIFNQIVSDKDTLIKALSVTIDVGDDTLYPNLKNILDY